MTLFSIFIAITLTINGMIDPEVGNLIVEIPEIKEQKGKIIILIFSSEDGFPNDFEKAVAKIGFDNYSASITHTFEQLPFGIYALVIAQDRNNNGKIDRGKIIPKPKEPIGMSNLIELTPPSFKHSMFHFNEDGMKITVPFMNQ